MDQEEIRAKIASFPRWHYQFDLAGNLTPIFREKWIVRHRERKRYFFDPVVQLFGGSLKGKRVLDLGCNAGFWSLNAAEAGPTSCSASTAARCTPTRRTSSSR